MAADYAERTVRVLRETGLDPSALCLELTESVLIEASGAAGSLQSLRQLGVHLAVDDFGVGYSSLGYLRRFPVDVLKIDRAFVEGLPTNTRDMSILSGIIALGRSMGVDVIVEGIEQVDQVSMLIELGCEYGQGFVFSRPAPADVVLDPNWSCPPGIGLPSDGVGH